MKGAGWFQERAAFYGSGVPAFEAAKKRGADPARAEAEGIIAEWEALQGPFATASAKEDAIQMAIKQIQQRNRSSSFGW